MPKTKLEAPGPRLLSLWRRLEDAPGGPWLFARLVGRMVPYSGSLNARTRHLTAGHAEVALADRRRVRNHLGSIHAVALVNLGELAGGLAVITALPPGVRGIVTRLDAEFHAKARGPMLARARWRAPDPMDLPCDVRVEVAVDDDSGQRVATVTATWRLGEMP